MNKYMNEELNKIEEDINNKNAVEERFINLNKRAKDAEEAKAQAEKAKQEADAKIAQMEKENNFLSSFSDATAKFPSASEYKDKIKEKVMTGYSVDDATVAILHAEGKLSSTPKMDNVAGGSAPTQITQNANKPLNEMTRDERWGALKEAEKRGDLGLQ